MDLADDSRQQELWVILTITLALGGIFVLARVICRTLIKPQFGWDDGLIVLAWLMHLGFCIAIYISTSYGFGKHLEALTIVEITSAAKALYIGELFILMAYPPGKASVAYLLTLIFPSSKVKWLVWSLAAANALFFYINLFLVAFECTPVEYQWNKLLPGGGTCLSTTVIVDWGYLTGATGAFTDFVYAGLPWFYIVKLNMKTRDKIFIGIALSTGFFAGVCSILKIMATSTLADVTDVTYGLVPLVLWGSAEIGAINVAACIPTLRPLFLWCFGKTETGAPKSGYGYESKRSGPFSRRSNGHAQLQSSASREDTIYHMQTYDVTVSDRSKADDSDGVQPYDAPHAVTTVEHEGV